MVHHGLARLTQLIVLMRPTQQPLQLSRMQPYIAMSRQKVTQVLWHGSKWFIPRSFETVLCFIAELWANIPELGRISKQHQAPGACSLAGFCGKPSSCSKLHTATVLACAALLQA